MVDGLASAIVVGSLAVAAYGGLTAFLNRPPGAGHLAGLAVVEVLLVVQAGIAITRIFTGERPDALATFIGYLLTAVLVPPLAALWGGTERTRWGSAIIAGSCLVVPVLVLRLTQIWSAGG